ncbi:MAG TPA: XRE family transcriptional regulator [Myxococcota bacterium]|nr:XRE family transcriptional regulator [Myxococcota bacterium]
MHTAPLEDLSKNLSKNLRYLRERRNLTQAGLSRLCEVPRSTIANLEAGGGNPTLAVLARIASALQVSIEEILSAPQALGRMFPAGTLPEDRKGPGGVARVSRLLPDHIAGMEILRMEIPREGRFTGAPHRPGTREYLFCERGSLHLHAHGERFELNAGDVCAFRGDQNHSYSNAGENTVVAFGVVVLAPL